jgi:hypothetical protein
VQNAFPVRRTAIGLFAAAAVLFGGTRLILCGVTIFALLGVVVAGSRAAWCPDQSGGGEG